MIGSIYLITDGTYSYVGQASQSPASRFPAHAVDIIAQTGPFTNTNPDITKWTFSVLEMRKCDRDELNLMEETWIDKLNPTQNTIQLIGMAKARAKSNKRAEVERLLAEGRTYRDILHITGVPLGSITNINRQRLIGA